MNRRKLRKKRKTIFKKKKMSYQEFIDKINFIQKEKREIENFLRRVWVFKSEDVIEYMAIKKKNEEILESFIRRKTSGDSGESFGYSELKNGLYAENELALLMGKDENE